MQPIVNLEDQPGKRVGSRVPTAEGYDRLVDAGAAVVRKLPFPRGVFRFRTHEEADAWMEKRMLEAALKKARGYQNGTT